MHREWCYDRRTSSVVGDEDSRCDDCLARSLRPAVVQGVRASAVMLATVAATSDSAVPTAGIVRPDAAVVASTSVVAARQSSWRNERVVRAADLSEQSVQWPSKPNVTGACKRLSVRVNACVYLYRKRTMRQGVTTFLKQRKERAKRLSCKRCTQCDVHEQCKSMQHVRARTYC